MTREDRIRVVWIVAAWCVLIACLCIWPDFFTKQLFDDEAALWVTLGAMFVTSCFLPAFIRKLRAK